MKVLAEKGRFRAVANEDGTFKIQCVRCLYVAGGGGVSQVRREIMDAMLDDAIRGRHKCEAKA